MTTVACRDCDNVLSDEAQPEFPTGQPCPKCGSTKQGRSIGTGAGKVIEAGEALNVEIADYPILLLNEAADLLTRQRQWGLAVIVAHTACEVLVERVISAAFIKKNIVYLESLLKPPSKGNSLADDRNRRVYTAVTDDKIQDAPFWSRFKASAALRNRIVHAGKKPAESDAVEAVNAAAEFIEHVIRACGITH
jgi:hypothetical protein